MTQEDKDAIYGKAVREEKEARKQLAFVQHEIARVSEVLGQFSNVFRANAYLVEIENGEFVVSSPVDSREKLERFKISDFDGEKIKALVEELGAAWARLRESEQKVHQLGG